MALKDTINEIQYRDLDLSAIRADKTAFIARWISDTISLYRQIEDFLADFMKDGSIVVRTNERTVTEELLGQYQTESLEIRISSKVVNIYPSARMSKGLSGLLIMQREDRTSALDKIKIFRNIGDVTWYIERRDATDAKNVLRPYGVSGSSLGISLSSKPSTVRLTKASLEDALDFLLLI